MFYTISLIRKLFLPVKILILNMSLLFKRSQGFYPLTGLWELLKVEYLLPQPFFKPIHPFPAYHCFSIG